MIHVSHRQSDTVGALTPTWSPQADRIAYVEDCPCGTTTFYRIVVINADGSGRQIVTTGSTSDSQWAPSWSPDGHRIAFFEGSAQSDMGTLTLMNPDGSGKTPLPYKHVISVSEHMSWSPDGKQVTFNDANNKIWVANVNGSGETSIATGAIPDWSPDGTEIAYTENFGRANPQIAVVHPDGSENTPIASGFQWPAWSPDGAHLVAAETSSPFSLVVMNRDGSNQTPLGIKGRSTVLGWPQNPTSACRTEMQPVLQRQGPACTHPHRRDRWWQAPCLGHLRSGGEREAHREPERHAAGQATRQAL
jgi:Tol biopolymer transport system component